MGKWAESFRLERFSQVKLTASVLAEGSNKKILLEETFDLPDDSDSIDLSILIFAHGIYGDALKVPQFASISYTVRDKIYSSEFDVTEYKIAVIIEIEQLS